MNPINSRHADAIACMGANCVKREKCARYHAPYPARDTPFDRLCPPGSWLMWLHVDERPSFPVRAGMFAPMVSA